MDNVRLMDRTDTKFVFRSDCLPMLLNEIKDAYRVLEVNGVIPNRYETLYFDSDDYNLYLQTRIHAVKTYLYRYPSKKSKRIDVIEVTFNNSALRWCKTPCYRI